MGCRFLIAFDFFVLIVGMATFTLPMLVCLSLLLWSLQCEVCVPSLLTVSLYSAFLLRQRQTVIQLVFMLSLFSQFV